MDNGDNMSLLRSVDEHSQNKCDYSDFRRTFNRQLMVFYKSQALNLKKPWTRARISEVIQHVKESKVAVNTGKRRTPMQYYWGGKYETVIINGFEYLTFKKNSPKDPTVRVTAIEDYFDILLKTHEENGHGGRDKIVKIIKDKYYIQKKPIEMFVSLCPVCETKRSSLPKKNVVSKPLVSVDISSRGQIDVLDFQSLQDAAFKFLLHYQDIVTKFIQLRPLTSKEPQEIALELVKIFLVFGAPTVLQSSVSREFTITVVEEVSKLWTQCKMVHGSLKMSEVDINKSVERTSEDVKKKLSVWMSENQKMSWSFGCHFVQFQINAAHHSNIGRSPYRALFGCDPKLGLNNIPEDILNSIKSEEELESFHMSEASSMECKDDNEISFITIDDSPEAVEPKAAEPSPPPPALLCDECGLAFTGFIYECVQCGHRMCSACDHVGAHKDHYVLRIPADRPKSETDKMMSKVRAAIGVEKLSRPARDKDKARRVPQVSDSEPDEVADGTSEAEDTAMTVKMEVEVEEFDPLQARVAPAPALAADDARVNEVEVTIKSEPPDEESYSDPKCNSADPCNVSWTMPTATTTIKREVDESEPGSSQQKKKRQKKGKADT